MTEMLDLNNPRWSELKHAYGPASDTPGLLRKLEITHDGSANAEPWFSLWSSLAHQGDVYSASFAAVPHVVRVLSSAPTQAGYVFFQFPAWIEICRHKTMTAIPDDLAVAYFEALGKLPALVAEAATKDLDAGRLVCALSAIAAVKQSHVIAEAILELTPALAREFLDSMPQNQN
jgi:hypothetical protein